MLCRLRTKHPIFYCVLASVFYFAFIQIGTTLLYILLLALMNAGLMSGMDTYLLELIMEVFGITAALVMIKRTGREKLLTMRGCGFIDGILVGMWPFAIIMRSLAVSLATVPSGAHLRSPASLMIFLLAMLAIGVSEELLYRGIVAQTLLEHFGTSRAGVWKACLLSGLLFGAAHLTNMLGGEPFSVLMQCMAAGAFGVTLAAIYFRTGNIWVTVLLHALMDIASLWQSGAYGVESIADVVNSYDATKLIAVAIYILPVLFLLRKSRIGEVELYFGHDCEKLK